MFKPVYLAERIRIMLCILLVFIYSCNVTDKHKDKIIKSAGLKNDFKILRQTLEEAHPGLYWYTEKPLMDKHFDSIYALLDTDMTRVTFFKTLLPLIAKIKCLHTNVQLLNEPGNSRVKFTKILPYHFFCTNGKIYITNDYSNLGHTGAEVLSINNVSSKKITQTLLNSLPSDGYNETYKYQLLNSGAFGEGYALFFGQPESFAVEVIDSGCIKPVIYTVKAKSVQDIPGLNNKPSRQSVYVDFTNDSSTAVLTVNTFEMNTNKFNEIISAIFKTIKDKNIQQLIIDLRKNGGGNNDNVPQLLSFLATDTFLHLKRAERNAGNFTYLQYFDNKEAIKNLGGVYEHHEKYLMNYRYAGTSYTQPVSALGYTGKVVVLTSGHTTSAASEFAAIAHYTNRAIIVGEETGGCYYGATGGTYIQLILPASKINVRIPTIRIFTAVTEDSLHPKGRGTFPDYTVTPQINDILKGRDVQLEAAFQVLSKKATGQ